MVYFLTVEKGRAYKIKRRNELGNRRSGKFYYRNEREVMECLGLEQVPGSGSGWVCKEDGESEDLLCQLKSTDAQSIRIQKLDIAKLEHNAMVSHRLPIFAINFLSDNSIYLLVSPESLLEVAEYLNTGNKPKPIEEGLRIDSVASKVHRKVIGSGASVRDEMRAEREAKSERKERSAT